jgi:hypothetical protein
LMVDGTGYGFRDRYALKWFRGTEVRLVQSHVRLVLLVAVDDKVVLGGAVGPPYASEVELLRRILARKSALPSLPLVGDRVYDSIDLLQQIQKLGAQPAIRIKTTWRYSIRHQLRQISHRGGDVRKLPLAGNTAVHPYTGNFRMSPAITHYVRDWHDLYGI